MRCAFSSCQRPAIRERDGLRVCLYHPDTAAPPITASRFRTVLERAVLLAGLMRPDWHVRGALIATAELIDVHEDTGCCCAPWGERSFRNPLDNLVRVYHWVLIDVQPLDTPVECRGMLGLWHLTGDILRRAGERHG